MPQDLYGSEKIPALPKYGVVWTHAGLRALARFIKIDVGEIVQSEGARDLVGDIFMSLYKADPEVKSVVPPDRAANQAIMEWTLEEDSFPIANSQTRRNLTASLAATYPLWHYLYTNEAVKKALEKQKEASDQAKQEREALRAMAQYYREGDDEMAQAAQKMAESAGQKANELAAEAAAIINDRRGNPLNQAGLSMAIRQSREKANEVNAFMRGWGIEQGSLQPKDASEIIKLASQTNLRSFLEFLGRFQRVSTKAIEDTRRASVSAVTEPNITQDWMRLFPTEKIHLSPGAPPFLRVSKTLEFIEHGLLGWRPKAEGKQNGAFLAYIDRSGSMSGTNDTIAKTIALGVGRASLEIPNSDRYYELASFNTAITHRVKSDEDWRAHVAWASTSADGGTDFDICFKDVMSRINALSDKIKGIDFLLVSDGQCEVSSTTVAAWKKFKAEHGVRFFYVEIGSAYNEEMKKLSDYFALVEGFDRGKSIADAITEGISRILAQDRKE